MKRLILIFFTFVSVLNLQAQTSMISVAGTVMDDKGIPLVGVSVAVKSNKSIGTISDIDGKFRLKVPLNSTLVYSYVGYKNLEIKYYTSNKEREKIVLEENVNALDEAVVVGHGTQRKISVVGAVTTIDAKDLQIPAASVTNMLGGRVPGIISVTRSGQPGNSFSDFWIRGISTFGANQSALILIDGVEGDLNNLDPSDIESFSVLKDASATAVYGERGANGVVIVTTKRGKAGKLQINFRTNTTYAYSPIMPNYVDAYTYASLANEARAVRGLSTIYTPTELKLFQSGLDPDLYPNVNWRNVVLKDHALYRQNNLNVSGGGTNARYYISFGTENQGTVFKQDKSNTDISKEPVYNKYNLRSNVDCNLTNATLVSLNMDFVDVNYTNPGDGSYSVSDYIWAAQANMPPTLVPVKYSNGELPAVGQNSDQMSPYVRLNYTGYTDVENYTIKTNVGLEQDLSMLTKGLKFGALYSISTYSHSQVARTKWPDLYYAIGRAYDGSLKTQRTLNKSDLYTAQSSSFDRLDYFEARLNYERVFNKDHRVGGLVHFYRQEEKNTDWGNDNVAAIPQRHQALSSRFTYSYKDIYMLEGNVGYTGSENFAKGSRYGIFPAIAGGWVPSQYEAVKKALPFLDFYKIRISYGKVGNDWLSVRFPYLNIVTGTWGGNWGGSGLTESRTGAANLKWETSTKWDIGNDINLFGNRVNIVMDYFHTKTTNIFQQRANIPDEAGLSAFLPYSNIGSMTSWGVDGTASWSQKIAKDFNYTLRGNLTIARNRVDYWEQSGVNYPYQSWSGVPYGIMRGLIAVGLFKNQDDINSSPKQTFSNDVRPGDIKYKDVNGDGVINYDDYVPISYSNTPQIQYGFAGEFTWKNLTFSAFFEGVGTVQYFYGGTGYYPFAWGSTGNVLTAVADQKNRWTPASYSGTTATENPNAIFPRLTYGYNANNNQNSTFWLANGNYLRLKDVEISYGLNNPRFLRILGVRKASLSFIGDNLHVWFDSKIKIADPSQASSNGSAYPLQREYTLQLDLNF